MVDSHYDPSPEEIDVAVARLSKFNELTFEIEFYEKRPRIVTFSNILYKHNEVKPELSFVVVEPHALVYDPFNPIEGNLAISFQSFWSHSCTWFGANRSPITGRVSDFSSKVSFKCCTTRAEAWLREKLAKAAGYKFRTHGFLDKDKIVYE